MCKVTFFEPLSAVDGGVSQEWKWGVRWRRISQFQSLLDGRDVNLHKTFRKLSNTILLLSQTNRFSRTQIISDLVA